jgi:transcription initiation factor TFIID subunit 13
MPAKRTARKKRVSFSLPNASNEAAEPAPTSNRRSTPSTYNSPGKSASGHVPPKSATSLLKIPFNEQDTALIRADYQAQWTPKSPTPEEPPDKAPDKPSHITSKGPKKPTKSAMAEPRARVARHKGQMNFPAERTFCATNPLRKANN